MDTKIRGLSSNNAVDGRGAHRFVEVQAYHVPTAEIRLFSPQAYLKKNQGKLIVDGKHSVLKNINGVDLQILHDKSSNLPMIFGASADITNLFANVATDQAYLCATLSVTDIRNQNLTSPHKELLWDHFVYGHANMQWIQTLKRTRVYETPEGTDEQGSVLPCKLKRARSCAVPKCAACELAKAMGRGTRVQHGGTLDGRQEALRAQNLVPGQVVSTDQYETRTPGRLANTFGKEKEKMRYNGGTIYVDHATKLIYITNQVSLRTDETICGKEKFEKHAREYGIKIQMYHADNGVFVSEDYKTHCTNRDQSLYYSGVGAHHQRMQSPRERFRQLHTVG
eukprot:scaffold7769_cov53-Attheya_sp.AAC.4